MHDATFRLLRAREDADVQRYVQAFELKAKCLDREPDAGPYEARVRRNSRVGVRIGANRTLTFFINCTRFDGS